MAKLTPQLRGLLAEELRATRQFKIVGCAQRHWAWHCEIWGLSSTAACQIPENSTPSPLMRSLESSPATGLSGRGGTLEQGSPTHEPQTATGPWPVRNRAAQQEVSCGGESEASSGAPHRSPSPAWAPEPSPSSHPHLWKNSLPRNRSLVPERLGTAALEHRVCTSPFFDQIIKIFFASNWTWSCSIG